MIKISRIAFILLTTVTLIFVGCTKQNPVAVQTDTPTETMDHKEVAHQDHKMDSFACPMHPEVTGKAGDTCPKCGMELEATDSSESADSNQVAMEFSTEPKAIKAGEGTVLSFTPKLKDSPEDAVELDVEHTKKVHLIVVSDDLSWFDHIHPEQQENGAYTVTAKFPAGGAYTIFADYKPSGANHIVDRFEVEVEGAASPAVTYTTDELTSSPGDGFSVTLSPEGGKFLSNVPVHLGGLITKDGKAVDVNTLEDYLGAKAHMVVVSLDDKEYLHVHPGVEGAQFDLHTTFDKPGMYRGWLQFQSDGKIYTSDFAFRVAQGEAGTTKVDEDADHSEH